MFQQYYCRQIREGVAMSCFDRYGESLHLYPKYQATPPPVLKMH